jgi:hypothetical protein
MDWQNLMGKSVWLLTSFFFKETYSVSVYNDN